MAKQAKEPGPVPLFPEFRRRHPHLVLPKLLAERALVFPFDEARVQRSRGVLERWAELAAQDALQQKETSLDAEFLRVIFGECL